MQQHKPTVAELTEEGKWMDAAPLVQLISKARKDIVATVHTYVIGPTTARELQDVTLACTIFGYLPPVRLACIRTLLHPGYKGECLYPDCRRPECHGNKLMILSQEPLKMRMHLPHHKNQSKWGNQPI